MARSKTTKRTYSPEFKMAVALDVVRGEKTLSQVASEHGVAPSLACEWRDQLVGAATDVFGKTAAERERKRSEEAARRELDEALRAVGQLTLERDWDESFAYTWAVTNDNGRQGWFHNYNSRSYGWVQVQDDQTYWWKGGEGGLALADEVVRLCDEGRGAETFTFAYEDDLSLRAKIEAIATRVYRADGVDFEPAALKELERLEELGFGGMPVCMAKTQYSFSDDQTKLGAPRHFRITVRKVKVSAGAGFVVALTGDIMTMPGLPKVPAAERIDVTADGKIVGLF